MYSIKGNNMKVNYSILGIICKLTFPSRGIFGTKLGAHNYSTEYQRHQRYHTKIMVEIYFNSLVRAIGKVFPMKFSYNTNQNP